MSEQQILVEITEGRGWYSDQEGTQYFVIQHPDYEDYWRLPDGTYVISKCNCKIVEPKEQPKIFVKITNVNSTVWYKNRLEEVFLVDNKCEGIFNEKDHYHVVDTNSYISRENCVVVNAETGQPKSVYLKPRVQHIKERMLDITKAIDADLDRNVLSPDEWYSELQELSQQLKGFQ